MSKQILHEGPLFFEIEKNNWVECYCELFLAAGYVNKFVVLEKLRQKVPASRSNSGDMISDANFVSGDLECKVVSLTVAAVGNIRKTCLQFPENPFFFMFTIPSLNNKAQRLATASDIDRNKWVEVIKKISKRKSSKSSSSSNNYDSNNNDNNWDNNNRLEDIRLNKSMGFNNNLGDRMTYKEVEVESPIKGRNAANRNTNIHQDEEDEKNDNDNSSNYNNNGNNKLADDDNEGSSTAAVDTKTKRGKEDDGEMRFLGIKVENLLRFVKVFMAFPFVIVSASVQVSPAFMWFKSILFMRFMNLMMYVVPILMVEFILKQTNDTNIHRLVVGIYVMIYLIPVGTVAFGKLKVSSSTSQIEEGTFSFKPSRSVRWSQGNFYALGSAVFEWIQHVLYVLPTTITTANGQSRLKDYPPYLSFEVYFWGSVACTFACGLILILNSVLRGKAHYKFQKSGIIWFFLYNVGTPMYVTFVTILFMGLLCDHTVSPPVLVQDSTIVCYSDKHTHISRAALMSLAMYLIQNTLLPSGTFKETMRDDELDIMFVPVYLQVHFLFKAIFSGIYVFFYQNNLVRAIALTFINLVLLGLNNYMKPCSVEWINTLRDTFLMHASISGIQALNYLAFPSNESTRGMVISTLSSNVLFASIAMFIYFKYTSRSTEYNIAKSFLDLEWQVSRGGSVHPRVLEPLISLTLSTNAKDWEIAKKYISQLVWLISYPNMRVQFQSAWGLANLALCDEDSRRKIHDAGGTKTLFEWYLDMGIVVQLETLAALANLSLSYPVADEMVGTYKCIPFFVDLVASNKPKHSQFACIALANIARKEEYRDKIRRNGGIQALVSCIMSSDYYRRRYGCLALANVALSQSKEIQQVFESKALIARIIKMALRKEIETQREVVALIRNLCCHNRLRKLLLEMNIMDAIEASKDSVYDDVRDWCSDIFSIMEREIHLHNSDFKIQLRKGDTSDIFNMKTETDHEILQRMTPLDGQVEWSTWGSKLENMFSPIFATLPPLEGMKVITSKDESCSIRLNDSVPKPSGGSGYKDSYTFTILERPTHGTLGDLDMATTAIVYKPNPGYSGSDFFTFRLTTGGVSSWPATVSIIVESSNAGGGGNGDDDDNNDNGVDDGDMELGDLTSSKGRHERNNDRNRTDRR